MSALKTYSVHTTARKTRRIGLHEQIELDLEQSMQTLTTRRKRARIHGHLKGHCTLRVRRDYFPKLRRGDVQHGASRMSWTSKCDNKHHEQQQHRPHLHLHAAGHLSNRGGLWRPEAAATVAATVTCSVGTRTAVCRHIRMMRHRSSATYSAC
eukprot:SAG11_NODE_12951_length_677_cov_1.160900_1_plen_153_part_00